MKALWTWELKHISDIDIGLWVGNSQKLNLGNLNLYQTTDTPGFKFECLKQSPNFKQKFHVHLELAFRQWDSMHSGQLYTLPVMKKG